MSTLITIRGNSSSGKTTLAKQIQKELGQGTMLLSQDTLRRETLLLKDGAHNISIPLLLEMAKFGQQNCDFVIVEGIFYRDWYAEMFLELNELFSQSVNAYYFDLSFSETLKRHQKSSKQLDFTTKDMARWWRPQDYLTLPKESIFDNTWTLSNCKDVILSHL